MTPSYRKTESDVAHVPNPALQPPYLPSPQTPSSAFFIRTSKPSKVIKIAPSVELQGPAALVQNGMCGKTDSLNVLIPLSRVYGLILIS